MSGSSGGWLACVIGRLTERPLQDRPSNESSLDSPPSNGDHEVTQNMFKNLKHIGPGAIVALATIGAGETVLAVRVGAWGGYDLLWLILLAAVTKSFSPSIFWVAMRP